MMGGGMNVLEHMCHCASLTLHILFVYSNTVISSYLLFYPQFIKPRASLGQKNFTVCNLIFCQVLH